MNRISSYMIPLVIALLCLTIIPNTSARNSFILGSRHWYNPSTGEKRFLFQDEQDNETAIISAIENDSNLAGYTAYNWLHKDSPETTAGNIYKAAAGGDPQSIVFYIGEGVHFPCTHTFSWLPFVWWPDYQYGITTDTENPVGDCDICYDNNIYGQNSNGNTTFVFLWSCEQGDELGGFHYPSGYEYGMPLAWLNTNSLNPDGYYNPDPSGMAFLGFNGSAPKLAPVDTQFGQAGAVFSFLSHFYCDALCYGRSINRALDEAAYTVWGLPFFTCVLRTGFVMAGEPGNMVVYGDGDICLSDLSPPDVAITSVAPQQYANFTKTAVGWNYCMNVSVTAANPGEWSETFNVTAGTTNSSGWSMDFQTQSLTLAPGSSANLTFTWFTNYTYGTPTFGNYTMFGNHTIYAYAGPVPDELDTTNNYCTADGPVALTFPGDIIGQNSSFPDYLVSGVDLNTLLAHFGGWMGHNDTNRKSYFPNADFLNNGGPINGQDLNILLAHMGQHYP